MYIYTYMFVSELQIPSSIGIFHIKNPESSQRISNSLNILSVSKIKIAIIFHAVAIMENVHEIQYMLPNMLADREPCFA